MSRSLFRAALTFSVVAGIASPALAHHGTPTHNFVDGLAHPLGWDHLLAMVAVGLLAVRYGGRALWALPATFVGAMLAGGLLAHFGVGLPAVETTIATSVLVLGLMVVVARSLPVAAGAAVVGGFALFHGYAHILEGSLNSYAAGFVLATALLHASGVVGGLALVRWAKPQAVQAAGAAIAAASVLLLVA